MLILVTNLPQLQIPCLSFEIPTLNFYYSSVKRTTYLVIPETIYGIDVTDGKFISQGKNNN